jgi:hypothetical protein
MLFALNGTFQNFVTLNPDRTGSRGCVSRDNIHGGGLAGPVRTQKSEYFVIPHIETDIIDYFP